MSEVFFITSPEGGERRKYFPDRLLDRLKEYGEVRINPLPHKPSEEELCRIAPDATVLLTHWGAPRIGARYLDAAPGLKLLAHCAGSVARIASEEVYARGIPVISANAVMAKYVAEAVLGLMIAAARSFKEYDALLTAGVWTKSLPMTSLLDATVGLVGLGTVGRELLNLLAPFGTRVLVYDPYLPDDALEPWPDAERVGLDEALGADVVSVHASKTPETYHLMDAAAFEKMRDGAVFINTARGALVDTPAARAAIERKHLRAAFDVYEEENGPQPMLSGLPTILLQPHVAASPAGASMTAAIVDEIDRFFAGQPLTLTIGIGQFRRMTIE